MVLHSEVLLQMHSITILCMTVLPNSGRGPHCVDGTRDIVSCQRGCHDPNVLIEMHAAGLLTPLLRHDESSEVTTRSRELPAEEVETAELREQLETSLLGENVQIPVIVYEAAMLEKTQDQFCFPFSWSRTTKTAKVTQGKFRCFMQLRGTAHLF